MTPEKTAVQRAMRDVMEMKRAIARVEGLLEERSASLAHVLLHLLVLLICGVTAVLVLLRRELIAWWAYRVHSDLNAGFVLIATAAALLLAVACLAYGIIWHAARREQESFDEYLARNFASLRGIAFVSDLLIKFSGLSVAILAGRPDWVSPLLILYMGDYLLQGRFFMLPVAASLGLGFACELFALVYLLMLYGNLLWAVMTLAAITSCSLIYILARRRKYGENHADE